MGPDEHQGTAPTAPIYTELMLGLDYDKITEILVGNEWIRVDQGTLGPESWDTKLPNSLGKPYAVTFKELFSHSTLVVPIAWIQAVKHTPES